MDKGYYVINKQIKKYHGKRVAIHNKNGQGLLQAGIAITLTCLYVAIHNKNGQGLLREGKHPFILS